MKNSLKKLRGLASTAIPKHGRHHHHLRQPLSKLDDVTQASQVLKDSIFIIISIFFVFLIFVWLMIDCGFFFDLDYHVIVNLRFRLFLLDLISCYSLLLIMNCLFCLILDALWFCPVFCLLLSRVSVFVATDFSLSIVAMCRVILFINENVKLLLALNYWIVIV